jgi:PleD family two-component response regulator
MSHIVIAVVDDMFFASKIRAVAEAVGTEVSFPRSKEALMQKVRETKPRLVIVDLHNQKIDPNELAKELTGIRCKRNCSETLSLLVSIR